MQIVAAYAVFAFVYSCMCNREQYEKAVFYISRTVLSNVINLL